MMTIEDLLSPLCDAIRDKKHKSKQATFNLYLPDLLQAKEIYSWKQISEYINTHTNSNIALLAYRNMVARAKKKVEGQQRQNSDHPLATHNAKSTESKQVLSRVPTDRINEEWKCTGITSQRLIDDLNEYGLSPDEVISWGCANDTARRKKLTEIKLKSGKGK